MNQQAPDFAETVGPLLDQNGIQPVLVDIGASGPPRQTWDLIAAQSIFIGFDADLREIRELTGTGFRRAVMMNEAVTAESGEEVTFYLTKSPYCSSTLEPDVNALEDYVFVDFFRVERQAKVKATTLARALEKLNISGADWFKTDSQGTDLRLFNSLPPAARDQALCVEVEPGLIDAYKGEDLFTDAHRSLRSQGFWLSDASICGTARVRETTVARIQTLNPEIDAENVRLRNRVTPGWVEATYLRSIDHLEARNASARDYILLWVFALMGRQWGFALDVAYAYEDKFGADETSRSMSAPLVDWFKRPAPKGSAIKGLKSLVPVGVKQWIKDRMR